jgi:hypothetical protein
MEHPTAERPRHLPLTRYALNPGGTGYPRHLVTHNPCLPRLGTSRNRGPPEALIVALERLAHTRFHRALAGLTGPPTPT